MKVVAVLAMAALLATGAITQARVASCADDALVKQKQESADMAFKLLSTSSDVDYASNNYVLAEEKLADAYLTCSNRQDVTGYDRGYAKWAAALAEAEAARVLHIIHEDATNELSTAYAYIVQALDDIPANTTLHQSAIDLKKIILNNQQAWK